jgi:peptide/nickel transport system substrate-binding protein
MGAGTSRRRPPRAAVAIGVLSLILAGCGGGGASGPASGPRPDTLVIAMPSAPSTLDPRKSVENPIDFSVANNVVEGLTYYDQEAKDIRPRLAESWQQEDATHWLVRLRQGVTFHDGSAMTSEDVVQSLRWSRDSQGSAYLASLSSVTDAEPDGEFGVRFTTKAPEPVLPSRLRYLWVLPSEITPEAANTRPVGTGPYSVSAYEPGRTLTLARYDGYWGERKGQFPSVEYVIRPEANVRVDALRAGEAQIALAVNQEQAEVVPKLLRADGLEVGGYLLNTVGQTSGSIMTDPRVREAVNMAMDRKTIIDTLWGGEATLPRGQYNPPFMTGTNPDLEDWPYDPDRARQLVREAGREGATVRIRLQTDIWPKATELAQATVQYLGDIGLQAQLEVVDNPTWIEGYRGHAAGADTPYDMLLTFHGNTFLDSSMRSAVYMKSRAGGGGTWLVGDPELDTMVDAALAEADPALRVEKMQAAWKRGRDGANWVAVVVPNSLYGTAEQVQWTPRPDGFVLLNEIGWNG